MELVVNPEVCGSELSLFTARLLFPRWGSQMGSINLKNRDLSEEKQTKKSIIHYKCKTYTNPYILFRVTDTASTSSIHTRERTPTQGEGVGMGTETQRTKPYVATILHHFIAVLCYNKALPQSYL